MRKLFILALLIPVLSNAQFTAGMFSTTNQQLIESVVNDGFFIVEQYYQLEDTVTHQKFGRYGDRNFGKAYALGINVNDFIITDKKVFQPWEMDENYIRYRGQYSPLLTETKIKTLKDTTRHQITDIDHEFINIGDSLVAIPAKEIKPKGFRIENATEPKEGWFVWVSSDKLIGDSITVTPRFSIYKKTIDFQPEAIHYDIESPSAESNNNIYWGGVFLIPEQTGVGQLSFKLGGIINKISEDKWQLQKINFEDENLLPPSEEELTPIETRPLEKNKDKKKRK